MLSHEWMESKMNMYQKWGVNKCGPWLLWALAVLLWLIPAGQQVWAQNSAVCAEVKIVIEQKLSLERQAFDAKMVIRNGLTDSAIENVEVQLLFMDANEELVVGTQDPNATAAQFFYRVDSLEGINAIDGTESIAADSSAEMHWLIIPSAGTATGSGTLYYVGAKVTYTLNGVVTTVEVAPDFIVVKPMPMLVLDYFLPDDVYADDPFTEEVEPQIPFTLGVRIQNTGEGVSSKTTIESAQPKIVENRLNLLIGFEILGGYVSDQLAGKSLLLDFGDIAAGAAKVGRWNMVTTLMGRFVEFDASFTHDDSLGGDLTSLIDSVHTHTLVHDVLVDLPGRDGIRDFLARDVDVLRVYESDNVDTLVSDQSSTSQLSVSGAQAQLTFSAAPGFVYAKVGDPFHGEADGISVTRSDGKVLAPENAWLSQTRNSDLTWSYFLNVFDVNSTGIYSIAFVRGDYSTLSGHVYQLVSGQNQPLPVAPVTLHGLTDSSDDVSLTAHTNQAGEFCFTRLQPGTYSLEAGSVSGLEDVAAYAGSAGGQVQTGLITQIALGRQVDATGYDFVKQTTVLPTQASLSGVVYADMNGNGVQDAGESGIMNVAVILSEQNIQGGSVPMTVQTNELGFYQFTGLAAGTYILQVSDVDGMEDIRAQAGTSGGTSQPGKVTDITLFSGDGATGYNFMKQAFGTTSLSGQAVCNTGCDVEGIKVVLTTYIGGRYWEKFTYTDAEGNFVFHNIKGNVYYTLTLLHKEGLFLSTSKVGNAGGNAIPILGGTFFNVWPKEGQPAEGYTITYREVPGTGSISGKLFHDLNGNGVQDEGEPGLAGRRATIGATGIAVTHTDESGNFIFSGLPAGTYELAIDFDERFDGVITPGSVGGMNVAPNLYVTGIVLANGTHARDYLFASNTDPKGSSLSGIVYEDENGNGVFDEAENGIEGVPVRLRNSRIRAGMTLEDSIVYTDANGRFTFYELNNNLFQPHSYSLDVGDIEGMVDGSATIGDAGGTANPSGGIANIRFGTQMQAQGYFFAKRSQ